MTPNEIAEIKLLFARYHASEEESRAFWRGSDARRAHWHAIEMRDSRRTRWLVTWALVCIAVSGVSHVVTDHALGKRLDALEARCPR